MTAADPRIEMLAEMGACACRLGMAFGAEAERALTTSDRLRFFQLFDRCFFAVRVGIALELRLKREAGRGAGGSEREDREDSAERDPPEVERAEPLELERPERLDYTERDRDREVERASLPLLLRTLAGVVADATALPGPPPAALPTLQDLLARFSSGTDAAPRPGRKPAAARPPHRVGRSVRRNAGLRRSSHAFAARAAGCRRPSPAPRRDRPTARLIHCPAHPSSRKILP